MTQGSAPRREVRAATPGAAPLDRLIGEELPIFGSAADVEAFEKQASFSERVAAASTFDAMPRSRRMSSNRAIPANKSLSTRAVHRGPTMSSVRAIEQEMSFSVCNGPVMWLLRGCVRGGGCFSYWSVRYAR